MTALLGAFFTAFVFFGGGWFMFQPIHGLITASLGTIGLGVTFAALKSGLGVFGIQLGEGGITVGQLKVALESAKPDTLLYVANPSMAPVGGMFECRYGDKHILVFERMSEGTEIHPVGAHDLF
jgi:hypothetical protein